MAQGCYHCADYEYDKQAKSCGRDSAECDGGCSWSCRTGYRQNGCCRQSMTARDNSNDCSRDGTYNGMDGIPGMIDKGNLVGYKVEEREDSKRGDEPALGNEVKLRMYSVQMQPARREREGEQRQICI